MRQSAAAEPQAASGETCLSAEAWALVADVADGTELPPPVAAPGVVDEPPAAPFVLVSALKQKHHALPALPRPPPALHEEMLPLLRRYVPLPAAMKLHGIGGGDASRDASGVELSEMRAVRRSEPRSRCADARAFGARCAHSAHAKHGIACALQVSVMFVSLKGLRLAGGEAHDGAAAALRRGQEAMLRIQEEIRATHTVHSSQCLQCTAHTLRSLHGCACAAGGDPRAGGPAQ